MAWPFSHVGAPNLDTGRVALPTSLTTINSGQVWLIGYSFVNTSGAARTVTITDLAGNPIVNAIDVLTVGTDDKFPSFQPEAGVRWQASGSGVIGKIWGYV